MVDASAVQVDVQAIAVCASRQIERHGLNAVVSSTGGDLALSAVDRCESDVCSLAYARPQADRIIRFLVALWWIS